MVHLHHRFANVLPRNLSHGWGCFHVSKPCGQVKNTWFFMQLLMMEEPSDRFTIHEMKTPCSQFSGDENCSCFCDCHIVTCLQAAWSRHPWFDSFSWDMFEVGCPHLSIVDGTGQRESFKSTVVHLKDCVLTWSFWSTFDGCRTNMQVHSMFDIHSKPGCNFP